MFNGPVNSPSLVREGSLGLEMWACFKTNVLNVFFVLKEQVKDVFLEKLILFSVFVFLH